MPIPSFTGKQSLGTQIVFIKDGNIFSDSQNGGATTIDLNDINTETKQLLGANDGIEYLHTEDRPDPELQRFLDEKD